MARRYAKARKKDKGAMLDELCELTGWTRRHAIRALAGAGKGAAERSRVPRPRVYGEEVLEPLRLIWATLNGPAGKRLAPFMAEIVEALERCGELEVSPGVRAKLCAISAATIDRALAPERVRLRVRGRSGTKPGSLLRRQIPIRTFAEWDDAAPGFCEVDLVAHDGGDPQGEFCQTLDLTCVATGWRCGRSRTRLSGGASRRSSRSDPTSRSRCAAWTRTTARSSSTTSCSGGARPSGSRSPAPGPTARTTTASSSRRTGRSCARWWDTAATTPRPSSRCSGSSTGTCVFGSTSSSPRCALYPRPAPVRRSRSDTTAPVPRTADSWSEPICRTRPSRS